MADPKRLYDWIKEDLSAATLTGNEEIHVADDEASAKTTVDDLKTYAQSDLGTAAFAATTDFLPTSPDYITFDTTPETSSTDQGTLYWDATYRTLALVTGTATVQQIGQELPIYCKNDDGAIINGQPVRVVSGTGNVPRINLASGSSESTSYLIGIATENIAASPNGTGMVTVFGLVNDVEIPLVCKTGETGADWGEGLPVYLSTETGKLTVSRPVAPNHGNFVATIMNRTGGDGAGAKCTLFCHPENGFELDELHDVSAGAVAYDLLQRNAANTLWEPKSLSEAGVEPANANIQTHIGTIGNPHGTTVSDIGAVPSSTLTNNNVPSGFLDHSTSTVTLTENYGAVNDTFRVTITGTNFPVYINGTLSTKNTESVTQVGALSKRYFIFYAPDGTLTVSDSAWDLESNDYDGSAPICTVLWDAVNHQGILEEERHHSWRDIHWHHWAHHTVGPQFSAAHYADAFTLTYGGSSPNLTFSMSQGTIYDEDVRNDTAGALTTCNLFYHHSDGTMVWEKNVTALYKLTAGVPQYDNGTGLAGKTANNSTGHFVSWVYGTNGSNDGTLTKRDIAVVVGQDTNGTMTLAEAQNVALPSLPIQFALEWKLLYKVIFLYNASNVISRISTTDYRTAGSIPSGQAPTANVSAGSVSYSPLPGEPSADINVQLALENRALGGVYNITTTTGDLTLNWANGATQYENTLTGNLTNITFTNPTEGQVYKWVVPQHASAAKTLTFSTTIKWAQNLAPDISVVNKIYIFTFLYVNSTWYGDYREGFV